MNKLELTWIGKDEPIIVEPRILLEQKDLGFSKEKPASLIEEYPPTTNNIMVHGDNLLALRAIEPQFAGKVKCIYIDPPYNTGEAFEHYDDNVEHSTWLNLMRARLLVLKNLLREDGFFCCQIDDSEGAYLKVLLDEVFGRDNYETTIYVRVRYPEKTLKQDMDYHKEIEMIHVYRKSPLAKPYLEEVETGFDSFDKQIATTGEPFKTIELGGKKVELFAKEQYQIEKVEGNINGLKEIWASGTILDGNSSGRFFRDYLTGRYEEDGYGILYRVYGIGDDGKPYRYFTGPNRPGATKGKYYQGVPTQKAAEGIIRKRVPILGFLDLAASFGNCRHEGASEFRGGKKPEKLISTILKYFTKPGDLVLDSFLGSGTTAAVAQKMGRRWIGIEMGDQAYTLCKPRLDRVISGKDKTGVTADYDFNGGGSYRFFELAPTLIRQDSFGQEIINPEYNSNMLAAAVAIHEGYVYQPDPEVYWKQATNGTNGFLFVTTKHITSDLVCALANDLNENEHLIVVCKSFEESAQHVTKNITIKKIPQSLLNNCQFGATNYNLNIICPPVYDEEDQ